MATAASGLGVLLRNLRDREGWTLKEMSRKSGIPLSTLSKVEHGRLSLTYDRLCEASRRLGLRLSDLLAEAGDDAPAPVTARRSMGDLDRALRVAAPDRDHYYLCADLRRKSMIPVVTKIRATRRDETGELTRRPGEQFIYVLAGRVVLDTEFYDPVTLEQGQAMYIDSSMGHACLAADGCDEATVLEVMSGADGPSPCRLIAPAAVAA
jgi:transcriptional regulator with XRE-family HTH domain